MVITKACANFECRHQIEARLGDNPYDCECDKCKSRVCLLCGSFAHFPASCKERERWIHKGMYNAGVKGQKNWHKWGDEIFEFVATELQNLKTWRSEYGPRQFVSPYLRIGAAFDEMEKIMQLRRWLVAIVCCNTHLLETLQPFITTLLEEYDGLKNAIPLPQTLLPGTELLQLESARDAAARAVRELLSKLLEAKRGGSYRPPSSTSTVYVTNPLKSDLALAVPDVYVDTTVLPARPGLPPDGGVNWEEIMGDAMTSWGRSN